MAGILFPGFETLGFHAFICYMPVADASQEDLIRKQGAGDREDAQVLRTDKVMRNGRPDSLQRNRPLHEPVLRERAFELTGIPDIKA